MNLLTEVNDHHQVTESAEAVPPSPLDLSTKKRKRSDSDTEGENDDGPEAPRAGTAEDDDGASSAVENAKPTPLDLSRRDRSVTTATRDDEHNALRPSVVVRSPMVAPAAPALAADSPVPKVSHAPAASPPIADHVSPPIVDHASPPIVNHASPPNAAGHASPPGHPATAPPLDAAAYERWLAADYHSFLTAAAKPLPPVRPSAVQYHHHHHHQQQQQQQNRRHQHQLYLQQQQQLHVQRQQQLQLQIQLQQQQLAAYGGHRPFDFDPVMMAHNMASPLYVATASPSSSESNQFPFCSFDYLPKSTYGFGYPYFDEILDTKGARDYNGSSGGLDSSSGGGRSDCLSPESTTPVEHHHHHHHRRAAKMLNDPDVDPEEIAAIYRQSDFLSFRHRYLESLGPPKNFEKMRRSVPNKKPQMNGQQSYDQTYVMKRQKNNEAAKRSRDAKRQKYIENQISVMYLTKKVSEMKEIKRRLLMSM